MVRPSAVHTGLCDDPAAMIDRLYARLVAPPGAEPTGHRAPSVG